jgi:hypothetical protein
MKMARLLSLPTDEGHKVLLALQKAGLNAEEGLALIKDHDLTMKGVIAIQQELERRARSNAKKPKRQQPDWYQLMPDWWRTPRAQAARARHRSGLSMPKAPKDFVPRSKHEIVLLHNPYSFDRMWNDVQLPNCGKERWPGLISNKDHLCTATGVPYHDGPVWVAFDYAYSGYGELPSDTYFAASEAFSALQQFPGWVGEWTHAKIQLKGYNVRLASWGYHVSLERRCVGFDTEHLLLGADRGYICPTVRVL